MWWMGVCAKVGFWCGYSRTIYFLWYFFAEMLGPAMYLMSDTVEYCISIADNAVDG